MSILFKSASILYVALWFLYAMTLVGKETSAGVFPWHLPLQIALFLLAGMVPAYFAGKYEIK